MSTRYLKKIQNHNKKTDIDTAVSDKTEKPKPSVSLTDDDDNDEPIIGNVNYHGTNSKEKSFNVFSMFSDIPGSLDDANDDNYDDSNSDSNDQHADEDNEKVYACSSNSLPVNTNVNDVRSKPKNKKKKHKRKAAISAALEQNNEECKVQSNELPESPSSSCDSNNDQKSTTPVEYKTTIANMLRIHTHLLNPDEEIRRLCGGISAENTPQSRKGRKKWRPSVNNNVHSLRKYILSASCKWIPPESKLMFGFSMVIDNDPRIEQTSSKNNNVHYFVYTHDASYRKIQKQFYAAVESKQPGLIVDILMAHPFHVDSLLQFSEICKLNEDLQQSAEVVERALRCLEIAFHPSFNITSGVCQLSYKKQTNRALFIALFRHILFVAGRACYKSSLELCKVLISFDPDNDPLACVLILDWLSLRAREFKWFTEYCRISNENQRNFTQLPNIAYSLALAHYNLGDCRETADILLQNALFMFPTVLLKLLQKCNVEPDSRVQNHAYFCDDTDTSPALKKLQDLYIIRSHPLWRNMFILNWLKYNVHKVMDKIDSGQAVNDIKYCTLKRKVRYGGHLPRNITRHIILSDIKEITWSYPEMQNNDGIFSFDPLPPPDSIDIYDSNIRSGRSERTENNSSPPSISNLLSLFITSLFPTADENEQLRHLIQLADNHEHEEQQEFD